MKLEEQNVLDELKKLAECFHKESVVNCGGITYGDILALIALVEMQHDALCSAKVTLDSEFGEDLDSEQDKAITAYDNFGRTE